MALFHQQQINFMKIEFCVEDEQSEVVKGFAYDFLE